MRHRKADWYAMPCHVVNCQENLTSILSGHWHYRGSIAQMVAGYDHDLDLGKEYVEVEAWLRSQ